VAQVKIIGRVQFFAALYSKIESVHDATPGGVQEGAELLAGITEEFLELTSHAPGTPTPSQPGMPPSMISGDLQGSIFITPVHSTDEHSWTALVGPTTAYGRIQELGGVAGRGAVLPARPYLEPALDTVADAFGSIMFEAWAEALAS
jgi:phage gpG-like protein